MDNEIVDTLPVRVNVLIHVIKVIIQLVDPVWCLLCRQSDLVLVIGILSSIERSSIERDGFLSFLILETIIMVPDLKSTSWKRRETLFTVLFRTCTMYTLQKILMVL